MSDLPPPPPGGGFTLSPPPAGGYVPPPPMGYAGVPVAGPRTDGLAIGALIAGILSLVCFWPLCLGIILGPAAAIMGFISRQRIAASGGTVGGGGLALAGLILGIIRFVLTSIEVILWVFIVAHTASTSSGP